jgi:hypothetical protein
MSRQTDLVAAWLLVTLWLSLAAMASVVLVRATGVRSDTSLTLVPVEGATGGNMVERSRDG